MTRKRRGRTEREGPSTAAPAAQPGTELAYDVVRDQLTVALERVNRVDTKAGILVGVLIAAAGGFLAIHLSTLTRILVVIPLLASIILTAACLLLTKVERAPQPQAVAEIVDLAPEQIKTALMPILLEAYEATTAQADRKEHLLRFAVAVTVVGAVVALVAKAIRG